MSTTRWSARIERVSAHLPGILSALEKLNLTAEIRSEIHGIKSYVESFQCILMASIWVKVLTAIDYRNKVLQATSATLDVEIGNIQSLIEDLKQLRKQWDAIRKLVAENTGIEPMLPERRQRKRKRFADESLSAQDDPNVSQEDHFPKYTFLSVERSELDRNYAPSVCDWLYST
eukprot:Em0002g392a